MPKQSKIDHSLFLLIVAVLAWAVPGAGHFVIKERKRAVIIFITITLTFLTGLYVGSVGVIDPVGAWPWYIGQMMTSPAVGMLGQITKTGQYTSYGKPADIGQIYTSIAGMLNLLCIVSAVYMAYTGRGEMIGEEEDV
ncbi:MAG: hypothetical protein DRP65_05315 [Planctomycetota bacterium]|nr:MAG: hypothetical protein DRP65_05315 [Planctomycetota bacterium]